MYLVITPSELVDQVVGGLVRSGHLVSSLVLFCPLLDPLGGVKVNGLFRGVPIRVHFEPISGPRGPRIH